MVSPPDRQRLFWVSGVAAVIALGLFFRFYKIDEKLLWHDELATRVFAAGYTVDEWKKALYTGEIFDVAEVQNYQKHNPARSVAGAVRDLAENDPQHPPLYYVLTRIWVGLFGDGIGTLRALSALLSIFGAAGIYWLAFELFQHRRAAWIAVCLYAVSPFFVLYAQEAREYAFWGALIVCSCAALLRAIRRTEAGASAGGAWALYSLITVVSLYTSFTSASVIISQLVYLCFREKLRPTRTAKQAFVALAVAAIAFLPWFLTLLAHFDAFQVSMRWSREIIIPRSALIRILVHNTSRVVLDFWPEVVDLSAYVATASISALVAWAIVQVVRGSSRASSAMVVLLIFVPISMLLVPDLLFGGIRSISMRYLTPSWIGVVLALAYVLRDSWRATAVIFAIAVASCANNAPKIAVWTKATSVNLPRVAEEINREPSALLVGNLERHNPGNLMALSVLLKPGTKMQFIDVVMEEHYRLPRQYGTVFLFGSIGDYRHRMEAREHVSSRLLVEDHFLDLRVVDVPPAQ